MYTKIKGKNLNSNKSPPQIQEWEPENNPATKILKVVIKKNLGDPNQKEEEVVVKEWADQTKEFRKDILVHMKDPDHASVEDAKEFTIGAATRVEFTTETNE